MKIIEIYQQYQIMPQLAEHQLRVAAVADMICDHLDIKVSKRDVVAACLLHDMGNIIKFDLGRTDSLYPELLVKQEDRKFWEQVKQDYHRRYGDDEHVATVAIVRELGAGARVIELVDSIGFRQGLATAEGQDLEKKICSYCDNRVAPYGVTSLDERLAEGSRRYNGQGPLPPQVIRYHEAMHKIEQEIFALSDIRPEEITEQSVRERVERLKQFEL